MTPTSCGSCPASWGRRSRASAVSSATRAAILTAEGVKQSQILTAEGEKQSAILKAEGVKQATILEAEGQAKAIDPPASIQETMEKQMRADREKRAAILTAEGVKQSQILTAEGEKQAAILKAQGRRESPILEAEGQSKAIETVFAAIHAGDADPKLLAYQYLQMLPQIAQGESNKLWIIPSEFAQAAQQVASIVAPPAVPAPQNDRLKPSE